MHSASIGDGFIACILMRFFEKQLNWRSETSCFLLYETCFHHRSWVVLPPNSVHVTRDIPSPIDSSQQSQIETSREFLSCQNHAVCWILNFISPNTRARNFNIQIGEEYAKTRKVCAFGYSEGAVAKTFRLEYEL